MPWLAAGMTPMCEFAVSPAIEIAPVTYTKSTSVDYEKIESSEEDFVYVGSVVSTARGRQFSPIARRQAEPRADGKHRGNGA